jgi:hypothetical protein
MNTIRHLVQILGITILIGLCILLPFLPGEHDAMVSYDPLAVALSTTVQLFGVLGLLLVPVGIFWLVFKNKAYYFVIASLIIFSLITAFIFLFTYFASNRFMAILILALWLYGIYKIKPKLKLLKKTETKKFNPAPLYLIFIPLFTLIMPLVLAAPVTDWSRNRAIANSSELIGHIEDYHRQYGRFPTSLLAQHKDYDPGVIGVEKYHYSPHGDSYNLFFEQPRFLLDNPGTREWVVYNPHDERRIYSHTSWILLVSPEELERGGQGWYAVNNTEFPHWKYFWFD